MYTRRDFLVNAVGASVLAAAPLPAAPAAGNLAAGRPSQLMKTYNVPHSEVVVSRIAYGLAMLSGDWRASDFLAKSTESILTACEQGVTFFDTADVYAGGMSERSLGAVLKMSADLRDRIVVQTKCGARVLDGWSPGDPIGPNTFAVDLSRKHIVSAAEGSLKRLGVDRIHILLLHAPDALVEPEEVAQAFDELHASGKVLHFGVSSHNVMQIELLRKYLRRPLVANQIRLGLAQYSPIAGSSSFGGLVDYCRAQEIQVQAFSPLKVGNSDKMLLLNAPPDATPEIKKVSRLLAEVAERHGASPAAIMLAWLLRHPGGIVPITGATRRKHIVENCTADRVELSHAEWTTLFQAAAAIQPTML